MQWSCMLLVRLKIDIPMDCTALLRLIRVLSPHAYNDQFSRQDSLDMSTNSGGGMLITCCECEEDSPRDVHYDGQPSVCMGLWS